MLIKPSPRRNFIVVHPVNPPFLCPLVELVPSAATDASQLQRTLAIVRGIGQRPIVIRKECVGFVVNRLLHAVVAEAWRLCADGVVTVEDCDLAMSEGIGMRFAFFGPLQLMALGVGDGGLVDFSAKFGQIIKRTTSDFGPPTDCTQQLHDLNAQMEKLASVLQHCR